MKSAGRTLVKSPPEVWDLIDQPERMQGLMSALLGRATDVTVSERKAESVLRWQATDGEDAWIEVELAERGWGTRVEVSAQSPTEPTRLEGWLDAVLEELATPQKRPFEGMDQPPAETLVAAGRVEAPARTPATQAEAPDEEAKADTPAVQTPPAETPVAQTPPAETPAVQTPPAESLAPPPAKKRRRFFVF